MAFMFPMMRNCFAPFAPFAAEKPSPTIHAKNSRNMEKGGFVTMMSASSRNLQTSSLRKSPSPRKYSHSKSSKSIRPFLFTSWSRTNILPRSFLGVSSLSDAAYSKRDPYFAVLDSGA